MTSTDECTRAYLKWLAVTKQDDIHPNLEKAAKALFDEYYPTGYGVVRRYEDAEESHKENLRRNARAVIESLEG